VALTSSSTSWATTASRYRSPPLTQLTLDQRDPLAPCPPLFKWDVDPVNHVGVLSREDAQQSMCAPAEFGTDRTERLECIGG
jgi:hypothetical protein